MRKDEDADKRRRMTKSAQIVKLVKRMIGVCVRAPGLIPASHSFEEHRVFESSLNFSSYGRSWYEYEQNMYRTN